jgi:transposase InsO family protein
MCGHFAVSRAGFYAWATRVPGARQIEDESLTQRVIQIHAGSLCSYGSPRVRDALVGQGQCIGQRRVARLMRAAHITGKSAGQHGRSKASHRRFFRSIPNRERHLELLRADQVWVGDVTYLQVRGQWRYLAVVMDKFSRRVLGWSLDTTRDVTLTRAALFHALRKRNPGPGLVFHSDRGIEYAAHAYRAIMRRQGFVQSMNRPGQMNDNAHMESFFHSLKSEYIHGKRFDTDEQLRQTLRTYFSFYNHTRIHTSLSRMPPASFELTQN